jgi:hypothetical protein
MVSVETALTLARNSKGAPLSCIIWAQEAPHLYGFWQLTWEDIGTPLFGLDCHADRITVHLFILNNIGEDSDACTHIRPILGQNDGGREKKIGFLFYLRLHESTHLQLLGGTDSAFSNCT